MFTSIGEATGVVVDELQSAFRLGNRQPDKNRPLKVIMKNKHLRKEIIDNAKHTCISSKAPPIYKKAVIVKDLTPRQREENKKEENETKSKG